MIFPAEKTIHVQAGPDQVFSISLDVAERAQAVYMGSRGPFPVPAVDRSSRVAPAQVSVFVTNSKGFPIPSAQIDWGAI